MAGCHFVSELAETLINLLRCRGIVDSCTSFNCQHQFPEICIPPAHTQSCVTYFIIISIHKFWLLNNILLS
jgi:hypothetical protein